METLAVQQEVPRYAALCHLQSDVREVILGKINAVPLLQKAFIQVLAEEELTEEQIIWFAKEGPSGDQILKEFVARRIHPTAPWPHDIKVIIMEYLEGACRF